MDLKIKQLPHKSTEYWEIRLQERRESERKRNEDLHEQPARPEELERAEDSCNREGNRRDKAKEIGWTESREESQARDCHQKNTKKRSRNDSISSLSQTPHIEQRAPFFGVRLCRS